MFKFLKRRDKQLLACAMMTVVMLSLGVTALAGATPQHGLTSEMVSPVLDGVFGAIAIALPAALAIFAAIIGIGILIRFIRRGTTGG